jgi:hypothetical protein
MNGKSISSEGTVPSPSYLVSAIAYVLKAEPKGHRGRKIDELFSLPTGINSASKAGEKNFKPLFIGDRILVNTGLFLNV